MLKFLILLFLHSFVYCGNWKPVKIPEIFPQEGSPDGKPRNPPPNPYPHPHPYPPHHPYPEFTRTTTTTTPSTCASCKQLNQSCGGFIIDPNMCNRSCCDDLECQLTSPNIPDIGGMCKVWLSSRLK